MDPSRSGVADEHMILAKYLHESYLSIDMYDADTRFLYGTTKLPLRELLRQGRQSVQIAKTASLCSPESTEDRGKLQVLIKNVGHVPKVEETKTEGRMRG